MKLRLPQDRAVLQPLQEFPFPFAHEEQPRDTTDKKREADHKERHLIAKAMNASPSELFAAICAES